MNVVYPLRSMLVSPNSKVDQTFFRFSACSDRVPACCCLADDPYYGETLAERCGTNKHFA